MKTLRNTLGLGLIFSALLLFGGVPSAQAGALDHIDADTSSHKAKVTEPVNDGEFDFDFSSPFMFNDRIVINIYNHSDELLFSGSYTKEEMQQSEELKAWLKKSEFLLSIDNQHYYYSKK
ncbi:hypothetical protein [Nafulsella turpanensis]|uniref:hypothetical protein n=1 Tax=Nafulsella turpanensis TaxID=1265690 RepID=UPI00034793CC|nr:hypothetical protein [Nafulsella turpanensis]